MKRAVMMVPVLLVTVVSWCWAAENKVTLTSDEQKLSYAMGLDLGAYFKDLGENFDLTALSRGIEDAYTGKKPLISQEEAAALQKKFAARQQEKQIKKTVAMVSKNRKEAKEFLDANRKKQGIKETASGLQYRVIKEGTGPKPGVDDKVRVHYRGTLISGKEFDSSYKRNQPVEFQVGQVIPGWQEALQLMPVGSTYEIFLPPDLAYGDRGAPPVIEPGSMLIFKVELLGIPGKDGKGAGGEAK